MKKALLMTVAGAALGLMAAQAQAADSGEPAPAETGGWYVSVFGGVSFPENPEGQYFGSTTYEIDLDTGFLVGGAIGSTLWSDNVRGEIEVSYLNNNANSFEETNGNGGAIWTAISASGSCLPTCGMTGAWARA